jgi:hypothetical protein
MPHLIRDVAEGVWKNSLLLRVFRPETEEEPEWFFDLEKEKNPSGFFDGEFPYSCQNPQEAPSFPENIQRQAKTRPPPFFAVQILLPVTSCFPA